MLIRAREEIQAQEELADRNDEVSPAKSALTPETPARVDKSGDYRRVGRKTLIGDESAADIPQAVTSPIRATINTSEIVKFPPKPIEKASDVKKSLTAETPFEPLAFANPSTIEEFLPLYTSEAAPSIPTENAYQEPALFVDVEPELIYEEQAPTEDFAVEHMVSETKEVYEFTPQNVDEMDFSEEVMETYQALVKKLGAHHSGTPTSGRNETHESDETSMIREENRFETFIATFPPPEIVPDLEAVVLAADDHKLEETLVELAYCLNVDAGLECAPIKTAIAEIIEIISAREVEWGSREPAATITPELTEKFLNLLSAIGYKEPKETLLEFTSQYDLDFLFEAIRYLYQLLDQGNRQEFMSNNTFGFVLADSDKSLSAGIGRTAMYFSLAEAA